MSGLVINTNTAASQSAANLNESNKLLQRSLTRLSSGYKINSPSDDAGGSSCIHENGSCC